MPPSSYLEKTNGTLVQENSRLIVDSNGFMVSERPRFEGDRTVLLLGGSSIENLYIREDKRVLAQLEVRLAEQGEPAKVYSAGISNAHLLHLFNIFVNKGLALRPDYVVWYPTQGMDVVANETECGFWNSADSLSTVRKIGRELKMDLACTYTNRNAFEQERRLLRSLYAMCRAFGAQLFVATWPVYGTYDAFAASIEPNRRDFEDGDAQMRALNDVIRAVCAEEAGTLVDLEEALATLHRPDYFYDRNHPNIKGCELIAQTTARSIHHAAYSLAHA
jgi:hypothetical protein